MLTPPKDRRVAADIMRSDVISVSQNASVWELSRLLTERKISGVPVVDADGLVAGVVSHADVVRCIQNLPRFRFEESGFYVEDDDAPPSASTRVRDLMSTDVISAPPTATLPEVRQLMLSHRIHRILIVEGRKLLGIVTTTDILKAM